MYLMYYAGYDGEKEVIGMATSENGIEWLKHSKNPVLDAGKNEDWDGKQTSNPSVLFKNGIFHMWYQGKDSNGICRVGYATSKNGVHWKKHGYVLSPGIEKSKKYPKRTGFQHPHVIFNKGLFHMWFISEFEMTKVCYAKSRDGMEWNINKDPVLNIDSKWERDKLYYPYVLYGDDKYFHMWYAGKSGKYWGIGYAKSKDGIHWIKYHSNPVFDRSVEHVLAMLQFKERGVSNASVLYIDGTYHMWYQNHFGNNLGVRLARSKDGVKWEKIKTVLTSDHGRWDSSFVADPFVIYGDYDEKIGE